MIIKSEDADTLSDNQLNKIKLKRIKPLKNLTSTW